MAAQVIALAPRVRRGGAPFQPQGYDTPCLPSPTTSHRTEYQIETFFQQLRDEWVNPLVPQIEVVNQADRLVLRVRFIVRLPYGHLSIQGAQRLCPPRDEAQLHAVLRVDGKQFNTVRNEVGYHVVPLLNGDLEFNFQVNLLTPPDSELEVCIIWATEENKRQCVLYRCREMETRK